MFPPRVVSHTTLAGNKVLFTHKNEDQAVLIFPAKLVPYTILAGDIKAVYTLR